MNCSVFSLASPISISLLRELVTVMRWHALQCAVPQQCQRTQRQPSLLPVQPSMAAITSVIRTNTDSMKEIVTKLEDNIREKTRVSLTAYMKIAGKYIINVVIGFVIAGNRKLEGGE